MEPTTIGTIASIGSSILGGIGGGDKRPRYKDALNAQILAEKNSWKTKMQMAKDYGVHPLMALGVATPYAPTPTIASSDNTFQRIAQAGSDLSRAITAGQSNMERLQERLLQAQIQGQEIDNASRASQLARTYQPGSGPGIPAGSTLNDRLAEVPGLFGNADGYLPLHTVAFDESGRATRVFNTNELGDNEIAQAMHAFRYTIPDALSNYGTRFNRFIRRNVDRFHGYTNNQFR